MYQEINRSLATGTWGPDPALLDSITHPLVAAAHANGAPWLRAALARIAEPTQVALSEAQTKWLAAVAEYRSTHRIGSDDLLGGPTRSLDADAVRLLAAADDITSAHAQPVAAAPAVPPAPSRGARLELE